MFQECRDVASLRGAHRLQFGDRGGNYEMGNHDSHKHTRSTVTACMLVALTSGCTAEATSEPLEDHNVQKIDDDLPDQYTWLVEHGVSLSCDEARQVARGEILWDKVTEVRRRDPEDRGFITQESFIRVLHPRVMAEYKGAVDALPQELQSDPVALAEIRARLKIVSAITPVDNKYDLLRLGHDPASHRLVPSRIAAPLADCELPVAEPPEVAALITDVCIEAEPELDASSSARPADTTPTCSSCKVTCDLSVSVDATGDDEVVSRKTIIYSEPTNAGTWESDVTPGEGGDRPIGASRHRYFTSAVTCRAEGCERDTWKANVKPGNLGDGTMSVNIAGSTDNPDFNSIHASCSVSVNALAKTTLTMDKNADDCGAANKNVTFDHKSEILYAVHSEEEKVSSSDLSGSVQLSYEANQNVTSGGNANIKASGTGKDGIKVDGVDVSGQAQAQSTYSTSGKVGSSYAFRRSTKSGSTWQSGSTTLDFLDQINGSPSLTLTNECPQKTATYKYDLTNFRSRMAWDVGISWSKVPLCTSRIEAKMPKLPSDIKFDCIYTTSTGGGNSKSCTGKTTLPK